MSVNLTKTPDDLRARAALAVEEALRHAQPTYSCFCSSSKTIRLGRTEEDGASIMMRFEKRKTLIFLTELNISIRRARKGWFGRTTAWNDEDTRTLGTPLELPETCMDLLDELEAEEKESDAEKADQRDNGALKMMLEAFSLLGGEAA